MADLHHGSFSYSTSPTAQDLRPSIPEDAAKPINAAKKFGSLAAIFASTLRGGLEETHDEYGGQGPMSASKARESALPRLSFAPVHALALGLESFEEEPLKAIVFGNVSSDNYVDIFWDVVREQSEENPGEFVAYEVEYSSEPKFLVSFQDQLFELRYIRCDVLVRECLKVSDATAEFLEDPENEIPKAVQDVVKMIQRGSDICKILDQYPTIRETYSFLKRWIAARGLGPKLHDNQVFKSLLECQKQISESTDGRTSIKVSDLLNHFFKHGTNGMDVTVNEYLPSNFESFSYDDWCANIKEASELPVEEKLKCKLTIRVMVTYSGVSQMKGAEWLLMVQRRLVKLQERLERTLSKDTVKIWSYRLVQPDATPTDTVYEGDFILGLNPPPSSTTQEFETIKDLTETWRVQTEKDKATLQNHCFIRISYTPLPPLKPCTRKWPRTILTGENTHDSDSPDTTETPKPKTQLSDQREHTPAQDKAPRFRTAAEVLNRLRHDPTYNLDEFVVGYLDRVKGRTIEKAAAEWERETTAEEFIPEHRVEYFKRYGPEGEEVVWMKRGRVDRVFV